MLHSLTQRDQIRSFVAVAVAAVTTSLDEV